MYLSREENIFYIKFQTNDYLFLIKQNKILFTSWEKFQYKIVYISLYVRI